MTEKKQIFNTIIISISLFVIYALLILKHINTPWFWSDEFDVYSGGISLAKGFHLYSDYRSQHMPVSYLISALLRILGADNPMKQRLSFYALYLLSWILINIRYNKYVSRIGLALYPILFIVSMSLYFLAPAVMAEHITGIGFVILILEYIKYTKCSGVLTIDSDILISLAIFLSLGCSFVACFFLAFLFLGVICYEIKLGKIGIIDELKKLKWLIIICLIPWLILLLYFVITGTLDDFWYWSYTFNRTIYSKYNGNYGSNAFYGFYSGIINIFKLFKSFFSNVIALSFDFREICRILLTIVALCSVISLFIRKKRLISATLLILLIESATRDTFGYHGTQFVHVATLLASLLLGQLIKEVKTGTLTRVKIALISFSYLIICSFFFARTSHVWDTTFSYPISDTAKHITEITSPEDPIWGVSLEAVQVAVETDMATVGSINVPWFWEAVGFETINSFGENPPKIAVFNPSQEVFQIDETEYEYLSNYIYSHYTLYDGYVYIRNDMVSEQ